MTDPSLIGNVAIIAHSDHGESTGWSSCCGCADATVDVYEWVGDR